MRALNQSGVMRTLAEPSLTAISGEAALFKVGGKYQIPNGKNEDEDGVEYEYSEVEYGIVSGFPAGCALCRTHQPEYQDRSVRADE